MELKIHPLFWVYGVAMTIAGNFLLFVSVTLVALLHEFGHSLYASHIGFELKKIELMPFGAIVSGEKLLLSKREEILLFLAGPMTNFLLCSLFLALWWLYPESYPYTESAMYASLAVGLVNLLPALPLDGGRVLLCLVGKKLLLKILTISIAVGLVVLAIVAKNLSAFLFALFLLPSYKGGSYQRIQYHKSDKHGLEVKIVRIDKHAPISYAYRFLDEKHYLILEITDEGKIVRTIEEQELLKVYENNENQIQFQEL